MPGSQCCVEKCPTKGGEKGISYFRFPLAEGSYKEKLFGECTPLKQTRNEKWLHAVRRPDLDKRNLKNIRICSRHFVSGSKSKLKDYTNIDWVPTLHLGYSETESFEVGDYVKNLNPEHPRENCERNSDFLDQSHSTDVNSGGNNRSNEHSDAQFDTGCEILEYLEDHMIIDDHPTNSSLLTSVDCERNYEFLDQLRQSNVENETSSDFLDQSHSTDVNSGVKNRSNEHSDAQFDTGCETLDYSEDHIHMTIDDHPTNSSLLTSVDCGRNYEFLDQLRQSNVENETSTDFLDQSHSTNIDYYGHSGCEILDYSEDYIMDTFNSKIDSMNQSKEDDITRCPISKIIPNTQEQSTQTEDFLMNSQANELILKLQKQMEILEQEVLFHKQTCCLLQTKLDELSLSVESFEDDDEKTKYFTALDSWNHLKSLYDKIKERLPDASRKELSKSQIFIMTLMKLRFGSTFRDLAYRFNISERTVSKYFFIEIRYLYYILKPLIVWPSRESLRETTPISFRKTYESKVVSIFDCFEIFCEKPAGLDTSAMMYSFYKHHHTIKVLLCVSPQGTISFVSNAFVGRASDKHITYTSKVLDKLIPGDIVLADRGFLIEDGVNLRQASLDLPAFLKGQSQLHPLEIEETRKLANLRINVERNIGGVRQKYGILSSTIPVSLIYKTFQDCDIVPIDQIITICCALYNLCPTIVTDSTLLKKLSN